MELFRISREEYASELISSGSSNRWNLPGDKVLYAGSSRSLATLELVVHRGVVKPSFNYKVMIISVADRASLVREILLEDLPQNWRSLSAYSDLQSLGHNWYIKQESLLLRVPSAVVPAEHNFIINTEHKDFSKHVSLVRTEDYFWDDRLL